MNIINKKIELSDGRVIEIETGKLAKQADGSVVVKMGGTMLLATVTAAKDAKDDVDFMWFLWGGEKSPLCGRKLKTFECEYVSDKTLWKEESNPYYSKYYDESFCCQILHEFGLYDENSHIINGHTPVHAIEGENPVRANGRLFVIDGGFCRSMNKTTGIAGYTLIYNSHGLRLKAHTPFTSVEDALINNTDIESSSEVEEKDKHRMLVRDTDIGKRLMGEIADLQMLLKNYRKL